METNPPGIEIRPTMTTHEIQRADVDAALAVLGQICPEWSRLRNYDPEGDSDTVTVELPQDKLVAFIARLANERRKPQYSPR